MKATIAALISAAAITPVLAQTPTVAVDKKPPSQVAAKEDKANAAGAATPKERAKLAKAQKKQGRKTAKEKQDKKVAPKAS
jgi:hypothetical protein